MNKFLVAVIMAFIAWTLPALAQDKQSIEKNLPDELYGEWCYVAPDDGSGTGTNYRLPSWADTCDKDKILSISRESVYVNNTYCHPISKIKVKVECAPSGCGTSAAFRATCEQTIVPPNGMTSTNRTWTTNIEIGRYKGNLDVKGPWK
jgi:hypothetical protein